jgi:hypothetical protein
MRSKPIWLDSKTSILWNPLWSILGTPDWKWSKTTHPRRNAKKAKKEEKNDRIEG